LLGELNEEQRRAVEHGRGPALVLAGAGSGKTRVITFRIAYLIANAASRPENILAVTFTNKAAQEMRERVQRLLGPNRTSEPLVSTFHSLCVRILRREIHALGYKRDFSIYDTDDQRRLMKQLVQEYGRTEGDLPPREVLARISYAKNHKVTAADYLERFDSENAPDIRELYVRYERRLKQANALDFDDLLLKAVELLSNPELGPYYSDWHRYILVDEYQDTNRSQYELLQTLTSQHNNLFVVGDEDQSIYKFRGADIKNILNFERDFPDARVIRLEQNYRSTQNILKVAGKVVANNLERKGKTLWTENVPGDVVTCRRSATARVEALWVADRIQEILSEDRSRRVAILYRANFLSRNFEDVFLERGMKYAVVGSVSFFNRMEVKDILAYLRVVFNPEDDVALLRVVNTPPRGIGATTMEALTQQALERSIPLLEALRQRARDPDAPGRGTRPLQAFLELIDRWSALRDSGNIRELMERIVRETGYQAMLEKQESAEEAANRMANLEELVRAASESETRGETIFEFLDRAALSSELDQYDPEARIVMMTLHSAKGLEFDVVFLAGLEEGLFPHSLSLNSPADLEEERRLCYVGITRARRKLFLTWTPYRRAFGPDAGMPSIRSRFLSEVPEDIVEGLDDETGYFGGERFDNRPGSRRPEWTPGRSPYRSAAAAPSRGDAQRVEQTYEYDADLFNPRTWTGGRRGSAPQAPRPPSSGLREGMRVRHARFGEGMILSRERVGNDIRLVVAFSRVGRKTLLESFAKLEAI
jgi:DNA helicase-2/ATP-dependent DNA helicase PcrA